MIGPTFCLPYDGEEAWRIHMSFTPGDRVVRLDTGQEATLKCILAFSDSPLRVILDNGTQEDWYWYTRFSVAKILDNNLQSVGY